MHQQINNSSAPDQHPLTNQFQKIEIEMIGDVGILRLCDPMRLNAISIQMLEEIDMALDELIRSARTLIIIGSGRAFCCGAALDGGMGEPDADLSKRDAGLLLETHINPLMSRLRDLPIPWITAACFTKGMALQPVSGRGQIFSFTVQYNPPLPALAAICPYNIAIVELDDAQRTHLVSNIVNAAPEDLAIGLPVEVVWEDIDADITLPRFRLVR